MLKGKTVIVYLPLKPEMAKLNNLPIRLPILAEDLPLAIDRDKVVLEVVLRGLKAQYLNEPDDYYGSYLQFYCYEAFKKALSDNEPELALGFLEDAAKISRDYRYHFYKGLYYKQTGNDQLCEIEFKRSVELNPDFYVGLYEIGKLLQSNGDYEEAASYFLQSIEKSEGNFSLPFLGIVDNYISSGEYDQAMEIMNRIPRSFSLYSEILLRKGVSLNELQRFGEAEKVFDECLAIENRWQCLYNRSFSRSRQGKLWDSLEDLRRAYGISGEIDILYEEAIGEKNLGLLDEALEHCEEYYFHTGDEKALFLLVRILDMLGRYEEALKYLEKGDRSELKNTVLFHRSLEKGEALTGLVFDSPIAQATYLSTLASIDESTFSREAGGLVTQGRLDIGLLINHLMKFDIAGMGERLASFQTGIIPETSRIASLKEAGIYVSIIKTLLDLPSRRDLLSYSMAFLISGLGTTTAVFRILLHVLRWRRSGMVFNLELFLDEYLEEIRDLDFHLGLRIARLLEEGPIDIDTIVESSIEDLEGFVLSLLSALEKGTIDQLDTNDENLKEYLKLLI
jgi:tetratricopeptide (TPR) repeat protein